MAVALRLSLNGLDEVVDKIAGLEARARNLSPAFQIVADLLEAHVAMTFATQGARSGKPWAPLAPSTVRARTRRWGYYRRVRPGPDAAAIGPILVWSGRTRGSFRRGSRDHVRQISDRELAWGSKREIVRFHQLGRGRRRRPPLAFKDDFQKRELVYQPIRLWLQGVPPGAIRTTMYARTGLRAAV